LRNRRRSSLLAQQPSPRHRHRCSSSVSRSRGSSGKVSTSVCMHARMCVCVCVCACVGGYVHVCMCPTCSCSTSVYAMLPDRTPKLDTHATHCAAFNRVRHCHHPTPSFSLKAWNSARSVRKAGLLGLLRKDVERGAAHFIYREEAEIEIDRERAVSDPCVAE
jgi:hypothetical protein